MNSFYYDDKENMAVKTTKPKTKPVGQGLKVEDKTPIPTVQPADQKKVIGKMILKGNTEREIAAVTGLPKTTIHRRIKEIKQNPEFIEFVENKADVMEAIQHEFIQLADRDTVKKMLERRGFTDLGILEDKIRLLRGESTANISILVESIKDLQAMRQAQDINDD